MAGEDTYGRVWGHVAGCGAGCGGMWQGVGLWYGVRTMA